MSGASFAPSQEKLVTFEAKAGSVGEMLKSLSGNAGVAVEAAPAMAAEIVLVSVKDMPVQKLLDQIAIVTVGTWQKEGELLRLVPDVAKRRAQAVTMASNDLKEIQTGLKKLAESLNPPKEGQNQGSAEEQMFGMFGQQTRTGTQVIARLAAGLNAQTLANIEAGQRIVYSSTPTRMQVPLPNAGAANQLVAKWISENNEIAAKTANTGTEIPPGLGMSAEEMEALGSMWGDMFARPKKITEAPAKVLLVASRSGGGWMQMFGMGESVTLKVLVFDKEGNVMLQQDHSLEDYSEMMVPDPSEEEEPPTEETPAQEPKETPIKFSETALAMQKIFNISDARQITESSIDPKIEAVLMRPDLHEPLSFTVSEAILASAAHKKMDVIASVPDDAISFMSSFGGEALTIESFLAMFEDNEMLVLKEEAGLWTISSANIDATNKARINRTSLASIIAASRSKSVPSLDDIADFAAANEDPLSNGIAMTYLTAFAPSLMQAGFGQGMNWKMLRLYGQMGPGQRQMMKDGKPMSFASLSPQQSETVRKMVFGTEANLQVVDPNAKKSGLRLMDTMFSFAGTQRSKSYKQEPTEVMPNGLPPQGQILVAVQKTQYALQMTKDGRPTPMIGAIGSEELAMLRYFSEDPRMAAAMSEAPEFNRLRIGARTVMDFTFMVAQDVAAKHTLTDDQSPGTQVYNLQNLPEDFNAEIEAKKKLLKDSPLARMMAFGMAQGGGGRPPVPPSQ